VSDNDFERIGRRLFSEHLVCGNFGNVSRREGDRGFLIKRTGAYLDAPDDYVFVPLVGDIPKDASSEYRVHRAVFERTAHLAIIHAHPPFAVAASLVMDLVKPLNSEGKLFCPLIPVVNGAPGSEELANNVANALTHSAIVIARGHGTFAAGATLDEAFRLTSLAEHSCKVLALKTFFS
jgi:L-fuculose-phosphate aldolase